MVTGPSSQRVYQFRHVRKKERQIYKKDHLKAYIYQKQYTSVTDSIFSSEVANRTASMQILYEMREKEQENILLAQDNRIKKLTIDRSTSIRNMLLIAVFIFIVAIFWVIYLYY